MHFDHSCTDIDFSLSLQKLRAAILTNRKNIKTLIKGIKDPTISATTLFWDILERYIVLVLQNINIFFVLQAHYGIFFPHVVLWGTLNQKSYNILVKEFHEKHKDMKLLFTCYLLKQEPLGKCLNTDNVLKLFFCELK